MRPCLCCFPCLSQYPVCGFALDSRLVFLMQKRREKENERIDVLGEKRANGSESSTGDGVEDGLDRTGACVQRNRLVFRIIREPYRHGWGEGEGDRAKREEVWTISTGRNDDGSKMQAGEAAVRDEVVEWRWWL